MKLIFNLVLTITFTQIYSQDTSCAELIEYVERNVDEKEELTSNDLFLSDWLNGVKSYEVENSIVVVAEFRTGILQSKKYIFCGIPVSNWDHFYDGLNDILSSYGERFHKYIYDYKCNCY